MNDSAGVRAVPPADLSVLQALPGIDFADEQVSFEAPTFAAAARALRALQIIAAEIGGRPYVNEILQRSPRWEQLNRAAEAGFWGVWITLETERWAAAVPVP